MSLYKVDMNMYRIKHCKLFFFFFKDRHGHAEDSVLSGPAVLIRSLGRLSLASCIRLRALWNASACTHTHTHTFYLQDHSATHNIILLYINKSTKL